MAWYDYIPQVAAIKGAKKGYDYLKGEFEGPDIEAAKPQYENQMLGQISRGMGFADRQAPQADPTFRNAQLGLMSQLQGVASGQQQGAGELAVQRQVANALAGQQAQAAMARGGGNAALAGRQAARNAAGIGLSGAGQAQGAALGDQQAAQGLLGQLAGQGRQGDITAAQMQQQQMAADDQKRLAYLSQLTGLSIAQLQGQNQVNIAQGQKPSFLGQALAAAGPIAAAVSDERLKTDISDGSNDIDEMMDGLVAKRYRYKDEAHGVGSRVGIMAQDMERSKAGRDVVRELPLGKVLDVNAALSASLASVARLNERLRKVEAK